MPNGNVNDIKIRLQILLNLEPFDFKQQLEIEFNVHNRKYKVCKIFKNISILI